jgi:RimJ/RimL family protein N-acetyltransferase
VPLGVFDGKTMVGMVVCSYAPELGRAWIHRLMISQEFPNKGYTRLTMVRLLQRLAKLPGCSIIGVDYRPENTIMEQFYDAFGFRKTGQLTGTGDVVACLRLSQDIPDALAPLLSSVPPQVADVQPEPAGSADFEDDLEFELLSGR